MVAELPFILMHPKPEEEDYSAIFPDRSPGKHSTAERNEDTNENACHQATTANLIQLEA